MLSILIVGFTFHATKLFSPTYVLYSHQWPWLSCCYSLFSILCSWLIVVFSPFYVLIFANYCKFTIKNSHLRDIELRIETFAGGIFILNYLREISILDSPISTNHNCKFIIKNACLIIENGNFFSRTSNWEWRIESDNLWLS